MTVEEIIIRLKKIRKLAKISAKDLSRLIHRTDGYIAHMENVKKKSAFNPSLQIVLDILEVYNMPLYFFFSKGFDNYFDSNSNIERFKIRVSLKIKELKKQ